MDFRAKLERPAGIGTWTYLTVPFDAAEVYGSKSQVKVKGTINGVPYRSTLMPGGDGTHYLVVNKSITDQIGVQSGEEVSVCMEPDTNAREVVIPEDFAQALKMDEGALAYFKNISYTHQKGYIDWIESAKKDETRRSRIDKALAGLAAGKRLRG